MVSLAAVSIVERAWAALDAVPDPEVPVLSVRDLGIVREVREHAGGVEVVLTPTYSGCPATEVIAASVREALQAAGLEPVTVTQRLAPAWTTDWISEAGRRKLREYGIAPPGPATGGEQVIRLHPNLHPHLHAAWRDVACPRCGSRHTERLSAFGATACKALYRCTECRDPFEHFKPL